MDVLFASIFIGIGSTLIFDLWGLAVATALGLPRANWGFAGRWFGHMPRGRFRHADMAAAAPVPAERAIGWIMQYLIGILYAAIVLLIWGKGWLAAPTLGPALTVGVLTVAAGWFIMSPGMGNGIAASRAPNPWKVRGLQLAAHVVFGLGLYVSALAYST